MSLPIVPIVFTDDPTTTDSPRTAYPATVGPSGKPWKDDSIDLAALADFPSPRSASARESAALPSHRDTVFTSHYAQPSRPLYASEEDHLPRFTFNFTTALSSPTTSSLVPHHRPTPVQSTYPPHLARSSVRPTPATGVFLSTPVVFLTPPPSPDLDEELSLQPAAQKVPLVGPSKLAEFENPYPTPPLETVDLIPTPSSPATQPASIGGIRLEQYDTLIMPYSGVRISPVGSRAGSFSPEQDEDIVEATLAGPSRSTIQISPPTPATEENGNLFSQTAPSSSHMQQIVPRRTSSGGLSRDHPKLQSIVQPASTSRPHPHPAVAQHRPHRGRPRLSKDNVHDSAIADSPQSSSRDGSPDRASPVIPSVPVSATSSPEQPHIDNTPSIAGPMEQLALRRIPARAKSEATLSTRLGAAPRVAGLKLDFSSIMPIAQAINTAPKSASAIQDPNAMSSIVSSPYRGKLVRKKSGEIVRPALKHGSRSPSRTFDSESMTGDMDETDSPFTTKSAPVTPSCPKFVHFNAKLEDTRYFLSHQKPESVSRGGSPKGEWTTSASEAEEFPFPSTDDEWDRADAKGRRKVLEIKCTNMPLRGPEGDADCYVEQIRLAEDRKAIIGMVLCRNIAFQKRVAARFSFDFWQTTSEVTATYNSSVKEGAYDRFQFIIKLHDLLNKLEEKTLFLAIRYNTDNREIWDSNNGENYRVVFERNFQKPESTLQAKRRGPGLIEPGMGRAIGGRTSQWSAKTGSDEEDRFADMREHLGRLNTDDHGASPPKLSPNRTVGLSFGLGMPRQNSWERGGNSPTRSPSGGLPGMGGFSKRYDIGEALKSTRRNSNSPNRQTVDLPEVRTGLLNFGSNDVTPTKSDRAEHGYASMEFYGMRSSPNSSTVHLPQGESAPMDLFAPSISHLTASPAQMENTTPSPSTNTVPGQMAMPLPVPDLRVIEPTSPPATEESGSQATIRSSSPPTPLAPAPGPIEGLPESGHVDLPLLFRASAASLDEPSSLPSSRSSSTSSTGHPPTLDGSTSISATPSDSPQSPPDRGAAIWSPTVGLPQRRGSDSSEDFREMVSKFCWASSSPPLSQDPIEQDLAYKRYHHHPTPYEAQLGSADNGHSRSSIDLYFGSNPAVNPFFASYSNEKAADAALRFARPRTHDLKTGSASPSPTDSRTGSPSPVGVFTAKRTRVDASRASSTSTDSTSTVHVDLSEENGLGLGLTEHALSPVSGMETPDRPVSRSRTVTPSSASSGHSAYASCASDLTPTTREDMLAVDMDLVETEESPAPLRQGAVFGRVSPSVSG